MLNKRKDRHQYHFVEGFHCHICKRDLTASEVRDKGFNEAVELIEKENKLNQSKTNS